MYFIRGCATSITVPWYSSCFQSERSTIKLIFVSILLKGMQKLLIIILHRSRGLVRCWILAEMYYSYRSRGLVTCCFQYRCSSHTYIPRFPFHGLAPSNQSQEVVSMKQKIDCSSEPPGKQYSTVIFYPLSKITKKSLPKYWTTD